jgi:hypothetical protein
VTYLPPFLRRSTSLRDTYASAEFNHALVEADNIAVAAGPFVKSHPTQKLHALIVHFLQKYKSLQPSAGAGQSSQPRPLVIACLNAIVLSISQDRGNVDLFLPEREPARGRSVKESAIAFLA